jgi:hypothetical protein
VIYLCLTLIREKNHTVKSKTKDRRDIVIESKRFPWLQLIHIELLRFLRTNFFNKTELLHRKIKRTELFLFSLFDYWTDQWMSCLEEIKKFTFSFVFFSSKIVKYSIHVESLIYQIYLLSYNKNTNIQLYVKENY